MLKKLIPHGIAVAIFFAVAAIFFMPQLQGKKMFQNDILMHKSSSNEIKKYKEATGQNALWTNSMFGGMPSYQISMPRNTNLINYVHSIFSKGLTGPLGMVMIAMLSFYVLGRVLELEFWTSIICSIAFALTTNNIVLIEAGHNTKVVAVYLLGITTAGILHAFKGKWIEGSILFAFGLGYNLFINHPQMTYYYGLTLLILGGILLFKHVKEGRINEFIKPAGGLIVAALIALGASASGLWTTMEYSKSSMRGAPILKSANAETSSSAVEGLDWQYSMNWSNGAMDAVAAFIPGVVGGGSIETVSSSSASYKVFRQTKSPLYWGALPSTSGPAYMGCILIFLFILGMLIKDTRYKWWIFGSVILTILLSMGKNLEWFNRIFFDYFPVYNKFRAPSSITSVTSFFIPLIGAIVLSDIVQGKVSKEELLKKGKIALGIVAAICLFFAFMGPSFFDFSGGSDRNYQQAVVDALVADRKSLMSSDALRALGLIVVVAGAIWAYTKGMINQKVVLGIVGVLIIFDMWSVDRRYVNDENWSQPSQFEQNFAMRPVDQQILQDPDPHYRVMDRSVPFVQTSTPAMHHKILGGYHGAKLQRANDLIQNHIAGGNQQVINMLNTKYIIGGQPGQEQVSRNPGAYGNAWFVDNIRVVNSAEEEISALQNITANDAIVHQEFSNYINGLNPSKNGTIQLKSYSPNTLVYTSNTNSDQLALFSEMWYSPGWNVTIDSNPVDHIRANYALRALKVPAGTHEIVFDFHPSSYYTGGMISLASSSLIFIGMGWMFYNGYRRMKEEEDTLVEASKDKETKVKATVAKKPYSSKTSKSKKKKK